MSSVWDDLERTVGTYSDDGLAREFYIDRVLPTFAEKLARHGKISVASAACGLTIAEGIAVFQQICADLGEQAQ